MDKYVVYMHRCIINNKIYIGMTNDIERRWRCKGIEYKPKIENSRPFWNAICKYGWDNFEHIILEKNLSRERAQDLEKEYIKKYKTQNNQNGYNIAEGGEGGKIYITHPKGMLGKHHNEDKKKKQSELMKRLNEEGKCGAVWKNGHPRGMLGKHHSKEYIKRLKKRPSSEHPSARKVEIKYKDGKVVQYGCLKYLCNDLKISTNTILKIINSKEPYMIPKQCRTNIKNLKRIEGCIIYYIENTEVI